MAGYQQKQNYQEGYEKSLTGLLITEYAEILGEDLLAEAKSAQQDPEFMLSEKDKMRFLKTVDRHYQGQEFRSWLKAGQQVLKVAGIVLCILSVAFTVPYVTVEAFRIRANNLFIEMHDRYTELFPEPPVEVDMKELDDEVKAALPTYLLENFELVELNVSESHITAKFSLDDRVVWYGRHSIGEGNLRVDTEDADYTGYVEINGWRAFLVEKNGDCSLNWYTADQRYSLDGDLTREEIVTIAESINIS